MKVIFKGSYKVTQNYHDDHHGLDIVGISDKTIVSPVAGMVKSSTLVPKESGDITWEWGHYVRVDDSSGNRYFFCHMDSRIAKAGQSVMVGDKLGVMGNTGHSFGAHCHFEMRTKENVSTNPANFLEIPNLCAVYKEAPLFKWEKTSAGWIYGNLKNQWEKIGSCWYWFDEKGIAATGVRVIGGKNYCFATQSSGIVKECQLIITKESGEIL